MQESNLINVIALKSKYLFVWSFAKTEICTLIKGKLPSYPVTIPLYLSKDNKRIIGQQ